MWKSLILTLPYELFLNRLNIILDTTSILKKYSSNWRNTHDTWSSEDRTNSMWTVCYVKQKKNVELWRYALINIKTKKYLQHKIKDYKSKKETLKAYFDGYARQQKQIMWKTNSRGPWRLKQKQSYRGIKSTPDCCICTTGTLRVVGKWCTRKDCDRGVLQYWT